MKTIEIIVSPQGETKLETKGFTGSECQQASHFLVQALGLSTADTRTAEYYLEESQQLSEQEQTTPE